MGGTTIEERTTRRERPYTNYRTVVAAYDACNDRVLVVFFGLNSSDSWGPFLSRGATQTISFVVVSQCVITTYQVRTINRYRQAARIISSPAVAPSVAPSVVVRRSSSVRSFRSLVDRAIRTHKSWIVL